MLLRDWRKAQNLTLQQAAPILGVAVSTLCDIERGYIGVSYETIARIDGATKGQVTALDHLDAWRFDRKSGNNTKFSTLRAAGRAAMKEFLTAAAKEKKIGRQTRR